MIADDGAIRLVMALRGAGIADVAVLSAVERTPRDLFAAETDRDKAWDDVALPLPGGAVLARPFHAAFMIAALGVQDRFRVLQVPAGSGYQAAVLSRLCRWVYSVEPDRGLRREAEARFRNLGIRNIVTRTGVAADGWAEQAPLDRILLSSGAAKPPVALIEQLCEGGVLVAPVGPDPGLRQITRFVRGPSGFESEALLSARFVLPRHTAGD